MITERTNSRLMVKIYLEKLAAGAKAEKADRTHDETVSLSEVILSMTSSSNSANPEKMAALIESDLYPARAEKYMAKNWFLNVGIGDAKPTVQEIQRRSEKAAEAARSAVDTMVSEFEITDEVSATSISNAIEEISDRHFTTKEGFSSGQGHGTPVLLREAIGLPGDHDVCIMERNPAVILNAAVALTRLGVDIAPEEILRLRDEAGMKDEPSLGM